MPKQAYDVPLEFQPYFSDLVLGYVMGSDIGYAFEEVLLTKTDTMRFGSVMRVADPVTHVAIEASSAANADSVLVWSDAGAYGFARIPTGQTFKGVVAKRVATLDRTKVVLTDGQPIAAAVITALEAKGLVMSDKVLVPTT